MRYTFAILAMLCVLPALADAPAVKPAPADIELGVSEDDALTLTARKGQSVRIRLGGNATTGYQWTLASQIDAKGKACDVLSPIGKIHYRPQPSGRKMGGGGEFLATFQAAKVGLAKLTFAYKRPWEKDKDPIKTFAVSVNVVPDTSDTTDRKK